MESIRDLANKMLEEISLGRIVRQYVPVQNAGEESPLTHGDENLDEDDLAVDREDDDYFRDQDYQERDNHAEQDACEDFVSAILGLQDMGQGQSSHLYTEQELLGMTAEQLSKIHDEVTGVVSEEEQNTEVVPDAQASSGSSLVGATASSGQRPEGLPPTMPESINQQGNNIMENVDNDVAAMLKTLKTYDKLVESCAPVLMARPKLVQEKEDFFHNPNKPAKDQLKAPPEEVNIEEEEVDEALETATPVAESQVDPDIVEWMTRFSKLGNMKGYGR